MFERCQNCGTRSLTVVRDERGVFCSRECRDFAAYPGFCPACVNTSTTQSAGGTFTFNGIGTRLYGDGSAPCPVCHSERRGRWFCILFIPVIPLGKYRVKFTQPRRYLSRRLVSGRTVTAPAASLDLATLRAGLTSTDARVRERSVSMLGDRGAEAVGDLPMLEFLTGDSDRKVRSRAKWAVRTIRRKSER